MKSCAGVALYYLAIGVVLGVLFSAVVHRGMPQEVKYVYVHDMAARAGLPTCPKINSGRLLKMSDRHAATSIGTVRLECTYSPDAKFALR